MGRCGTILHRSDLAQNCILARDLNWNDRSMTGWIMWVWAAVGGGVNNTCRERTLQSVLVPRSPIAPAR